MPAGHPALLEGGGYPPGTIFVSKTATNGFAVGSDSNTLAQAKAPNRQTPFATIKQAFAQASAGDLIVINDGTYSGTDLDASLGYLNMVSKGVTLRAHRSGQVTLQATTGARVVRIQTMPSGAVISLTGIVIDGGDGAQHCIETDGTTNPYTLTLTNCSTLNPTVRGLVLASTKVALSLFNHTHSSGVSRALLYCNVMASGASVSIVGGSTTVSQQSLNQGGIELRATEAGASVSISGHTVDVTLQSSLTGNGTHDGIAIYNMSSVSVTNCSVAVRGTPGSRIGCGIRVSQTSAINVTPTITGNTVVNETRGGYGILAGSDGTGVGDGYVVDPVVNDNIISGVAANQTVGPIHGILLGFNVGGEARRNRIYDCGLAMIQKKNLTSGALFAANTIRLTAFAGVGYSIGMYAKGALNTRFVNNSVYVNDASANAAQLQHVQADDVSGTNSSGIEYRNNAFYFTGSAAVKFVNVGASQSVTFSNNLYYSPAALPANCFSYQGANYSTVATWAAAQEATAVSGDPKFTDAANDNFILLAGSACIGAGVAASGVTTDKAGNAFASPPSIGAYEYAA